MRIIADISNTIEELLDAAEEYINCAHKKKEEFPTVAQAYYTLSLNEMTGVAALHDQVTKLIADYRTKNGDLFMELLLGSGPVPSGGYT